MSNRNNEKTREKLKQADNDISNENIELQAEISTLRSQMEELQSILNEYTGNTYQKIKITLLNKYQKLS